MGHEEPRCPQKRRAEAEARRAEREANKAAWEARQAARVARVGGKDIDASSDSAMSESTAATAAEQAAAPVLSVPEEKETRKFERKLREVAQLEERMARGESLDALQLAKVARQAELEGTLVMQKVRTGYGRRSDISAGGIGG